MANYGDDKEAARAEVMDIADGKDRAAIEARARRVMAAANEIRARYGSVLDVDKRFRAIARAMAWAEILCYLDEVPAIATFSADEYAAWREDDPRGFLSRAWGWVIAIVTIYQVRDAFRVLLGKEPFAFYEPWGPVTEAPALF